MLLPLPCGVAWWMLKEGGAEGACCGVYGFALESLRECDCDCCRLGEYAPSIGAGSRLMVGGFEAESSFGDLVCDSPVSISLPPEMRCRDGEAKEASAPAAARKADCVVEGLRECDLVCELNGIVPVPAPPSGLDPVVASS